MSVKHIVFLTLITFTASHACITKTIEIPAGPVCSGTPNIYIHYDVNPSEGFNLRRDVYMRLAIMIATARSKDRLYERLKLVLPPFYRLFHWGADSYQPMQWSEFFDVNSLKSYAPVVELQDLVPTKNTVFQIDLIIVLKPYPFDGKDFSDKYEYEKLDKNEKYTVKCGCEYEGKFWGYQNIFTRWVRCVKFQGHASGLLNIIQENFSYKHIMIANAEILLHDTYGTVEYWDCRKSMKFAKFLINAADNYRKETLNCSDPQNCNYLAVHWRRRDFKYSHKKDIPSVSGTAAQIIDALNTFDGMKRIYIATDAEEHELKELEELLNRARLDVFNTTKKFQEFNEGQKAIIEQIICAHSTYFIGTHESTFTFRIQEERELMRIRSDYTFNRLCPDEGPCESPARWLLKVDLPYKEPTEHLESQTGRFSDEL